jgi:fatty-acyl-CoA synthase
VPLAADPKTLQACLRRAAQVGRPGLDGLRFLDSQEQAQWFDWSEIERRALAAAGTLRERGIRAGDRVAIVTPTSPLFMDAFFGSLLAGATPVPLYPPVRLGRMAEYIEKTAAMLAAVDAPAVVVDSRVRKVFGSVVGRHHLRLGVISAEDLARGAPGPAHPAEPDELALIQFSSGTTVDPKPVGLTHAQILANLLRILDLMPEEDEPRHAGVSWLPLYHDMGLIGCLFPALHRPGPLTLIPPEVFLARPALWIRALSRYQGTATVAPDFAYALCVERITDAELVGVDLRAWRLALDGAEPISARTLRAFAARFAAYGFDERALLPVYGLSEVALAATFSTPGTRWQSRRLDREALAQGHAVDADGEAATELVSVGRALPGYAVEVRDGSGRPLEDERVGRIFVSGPSLMRGYIGRDLQPILDGWLDTGDLGFLDQGALTVTGRAKDVIVLRGQNHAPQDIERALDAVAGVRTGCAAAVGQRGEAGEQLLVFVEARAPREGLAQDCRAEVLRATGLDPALVVVLEPGSLPRTSSGKIRRGEALRRWERGELQPGDAVNAWTLAGTLAKSALGYLRRA